MSRRLLAFALVAVSAPLAWADPDQGDRAEQLFQRARDLMGHDDFATACPLLEQSYELDHGAGTLLALALCHEGDGKPATALREYRQVLAQAVAANRSDRVMLAESHVQQLEQIVPRITVHVAQPEAPGQTVTFDHQPLDRAAFTTGAPVDPGRYEIEAAAPGMVAWKTEVVVTAESHATTVSVPLLERPHIPEVPRATWPRTLGFTLGGAGLAAIGVGSYFGVAAMDAESRSEDLCRNNLCSAKGVQLNHDASRDALVADIAIGVGGAALVTGIVLLVRYYRSPESSTVQAWSGGSDVGFSVSW